MKLRLSPRPIAFGIFAIVLTGCAQPPYVVPKGQEGRQAAFFAEFPERLFEIAEEVCDAPTETLTKRSETSIECESLPTPEAAAALILRFDGDIQRLPTLVNTLEATAQNDGFLVEAEYFFRVPQLGADSVVVRIPQRDADRAIQRIFRMAGGQITLPPV
ncbi:hypothetical protein [Shimia ponticola]|uniref:hypothetical protein n=1 Tax=Shimia ponticola TaxID=2582893 RepID=UPI0011BDD22C|nr:hypothetical protein [Shimia ponticola]